MSKTKIPIKVRRNLWFAAHGRCEFTGCNKQLDVHGITMDACNISNFAHIIGDSVDGPRGSERSQELARDPNNIILLCPECHKLIDNEGEVKYTVEMLKAMKREHEERINLATSIQPQKKSLVVVYGPKIGGDTPAFQREILHSTIFPDWYPVSFNPIEIQINNSVSNDSELDYWESEIKQIEKLCAERIIKPLTEGEISHISLFPMGPQSLLVKLGTVLNDKYPVLVYQKHRIPDTWRWLDEKDGNKMELIEPEDKTKDPVLVIALSANAIKERIVRQYGNSSSIWCITCESPNNDMMRTRIQMDYFNHLARKTMDLINSSCPRANCLKIFLAAPASCAVELGRIRMPKADLPWVLYDYRNDKKVDIETIKIN